MEEKITIFLMLFGVALPWLMSIGQLTLRNRGEGNYIAFALFFTVGLWQIVLGTFYLGLLKEFHYFVWVDVAFMYLSGPLLYFYYQKIIDPHFRFKIRHFMHFLPSIMTFFILMPYYFKDPDLKIKLRKATLDSQIFAESSFGHLLIFGGLLISILYLIILLKENFYLFFSSRNQTMKKPLIRITLFQIVYLLIAVMSAVIAKIFFGNVFKTFSILITIYLLMIYLTGLRYPDFLQIIRVEAEKVRYEHSRIEGLDVKIVTKRLRNMMEKEKAFCDEDISLARVAHELSITTHQLSEILNNRLRKSFHDFINEYRVEEAEKLLVQEPDRSIISVGYAVGFNSTSTFYTAFQRHTGLAPGKFRKKST